MKTYSQLLKELNMTIATKGTTDQFLQSVNPRGKTNVRPNKIDHRIIRNPKFTK